MLMISVRQKRWCENQSVYDMAYVHFTLSHLEPLHAVRYISGSTSASAFFASIHALFWLGIQYDTCAHHNQLSFRQAAKDLL